MKFNKKEFATLESIIKHRRDVRGNRFIDKPLSIKKVKKLLSITEYAPSVGFSQPWKFIIIDDKKVKKEVYKNFKSEYKESKKLFKNRLYSKLKLEGIKKAPINIAVFYEKSKNPTLGQTTMEEMGQYSVVCAIENLWLSARAKNIGIGWVSILNPERVKKTLEVPKEYKLIAYLCVGYVDEFLDKPELELLKWKKRKKLKKAIYKNRFER